MISNNALASNCGRWMWGARPNDEVIWTADDSFRLSARRSEIRRRVKSLVTAPRGRRLQPGRCQRRCSAPRAARCKGLVEASSLCQTPIGLSVPDPQQSVPRLEPGRPASRYSRPGALRYCSAVPAFDLPAPQKSKTTRERGWVDVPYYYSVSVPGVVTEQEARNNGVVIRADEGARARVGQFRGNSLVRS